MTEKTKKPTAGEPAGTKPTSEKPETAKPPKRRLTFRERERKFYAAFGNGPVAMSSPGRSSQTQEAPAPEKPKE